MTSYKTETSHRCRKQSCSTNGEGWEGYIRSLGSATTCKIDTHCSTHWASLMPQWSRICLLCRRRGFDPWVRKIPRRRKWLPAPVFLPGEFHGQRSLAGYCPWGHKESDMTEHTHTCVCVCVCVCIRSKVGAFD